MARTATKKSTVRRNKRYRRLERRHDRPSHYFVPTLIRWPQGLLDAVDAELERRKEKTPDWKREWWKGPHSRASTVRELVAERLKVSDRDGSPAKGAAK